MEDFRISVVNLLLLGVSIYSIRGVESQRVIVLGDAKFMLYFQLFFLLGFTSLKNGRVAHTDPCLEQQKLANYVIHILNLMRF